MRKTAPFVFIVLVYPIISSCVQSADDMRKTPVSLPTPWISAVLVGHADKRYYTYSAVQVEVTIENRGRTTMQLFEVEPLWTCYQIKVRRDGTEVPISWLAGLDNDSNFVSGALTYLEPGKKRVANFYLTDIFSFNRPGVYEITIARRVTDDNGDETINLHRPLTLKVVREDD